MKNRIATLAKTFQGLVKRELLYDTDAEILARHVITNELEARLNELFIVKNIPGRDVYLLTKMEELTNQLEEIRL